MNKPIDKSVYFAVAVLVIFIILVTVEAVGKTGDRNETKSPKKQMAQGLDSNRLALILRAGRIIYPGDLYLGTIGVEDGISILKLSDEALIYQAPANWGKRAIKKGEYDAVNNNTLINPRNGRPVSLILSDGTKVWLRPGSRLYFENVFFGRNRSVSLNGEAYFEVSSGPAFPFNIYLLSGLVADQKRRIESWEAASM